MISDTGQEMIHNIYYVSECECGYVIKCECGYVNKYDNVYVKYRF